MKALGDQFSDLEPSRTVQKILLSTTSRLVGEFESDDVLLTHAWPDVYDRQGHLRWEHSPISRSAYVLSFRTAANSDEEGERYPDFGPTGDVIAAVASVLFGKRFDNHGALEMSGLFRLPEMTTFNRPCDHRQPYNSHRPRVDLAVPLELGEMKRLRFFLEGTSSQESDLWLGACRFYLRALQTVESDAEVAYIHLITSGEILSNSPRFFELDVIDDGIKNVLSRVEGAYSGGAKDAKFLKGRFRQIKKRYVGAMMQLQDAGLFVRSEAEHHYEALKAEDHHDALAAAYDLRSLHLHTGKPFGRWKRPRTYIAERESCEPVLPDQGLAKALFRAPTFCGLERLTRYAILRYGKALGADLSGLDQTDGSQAEESSKAISSDT